MNYRVVVLGALLLVVGGFTFAFPQVISPPSTLDDHTALVRVSPNGYSAVQESLSTQDTLQVTLSSSPSSVDFFLMNSSAYSTWNATGRPTVNVYPESRLNARNYTFSVAGAGVSQGYALVFVSRSSTTSTNVLIHLVLQRELDLTHTLVVPGAFVGLGIVLAGFGATRKKKQSQAQGPPTTRADLDHLLL